MTDPQEDQDIPQKFLDLADQRLQEQIETSVDEEAYANGDWTERMYELAAELWAEAEQAKLEADADHAQDMMKEARL